MRPIADQAECSMCGKWFPRLLRGALCPSCHRDSVEFLALVNAAAEVQKKSIITEDEQFVIAT